MSKKVYNCNAEDIQVKEDGKTVILPPEIHLALGLKKGEQIRMTKSNRGGRQITCEIVQNED